MRRRELICLIGGSAVATWSLAPGAQQPAMPVIGFEYAPFLATFRQGLKQAGTIEGQDATKTQRLVASRDPTGWL